MNKDSQFEGPSSRTIQLGNQARPIFGMANDPYFLGISSFQGTNGLFERALLRLLADSPVVLDIGANIGITATLAGVLAPSAHIVAVEPSPKAARCLEMTVSANNLQDRVRILRAAVGAETGEMQLMEAEFLAGSYLTNDAVASGHATITVPIVTLDEIVHRFRLSRLDIVKIDVEGFEQDVLDGGRKTLTGLAPLVVMEFNAWTITAWRNMSPRALLDAIRQRFGAAYYMRDGQLTAATTADDYLTLLHRNMVINGCVDDIVFCADPERLARFVQD